MDRRHQRAIEIQEIREAVLRGNPQGISAAILRRDGDELAQDTLRSLMLDTERKGILLDFARDGDPYVVGKVFNDLLGHLIGMREKAKKIADRTQDKSREASVLYNEAARLENFLRQFAAVHDLANRHVEVPPQSDETLNQTGEYPTIEVVAETAAQENAA